MLGRRFTSCREGSLAVEGAVALPVLILMTFGAVDATLLFIQTHTLEAGLTAGGSYLAQSNATPLDETRARRIAVTGMPAPGGTPRLNGWTVSDVSINYTVTPHSNQYRGEAPVRVARLQSSVPYTGFGILSSVTRGSIELTAIYETRLER